MTAILVLAAWGIASGVSAPDAIADGRPIPVEMTADEGLVVDLAKGTGLARGNVVLRRGDLVVCCDRAEARYGKAGIDRIACRGRVIVRHGEQTLISAQTIEFQVASNRLLLRGQVDVWRKEGRLRGNKMVFDIDSERLEVSGAQSRLIWAPTVLPPARRSCPKPGGGGAPP